MRRKCKKVVEQKQTRKMCANIMRYGIQDDFDFSFLVLSLYQLLDTAQKCFTCFSLLFILNTMNV